MDTTSVNTVPPELQNVSTERLISLMSIKKLITNISNQETEIAELEKTSDVLNKEVEEKLSKLGDTTLVRCPSCGTVFDPVNAELFPHTH